MCPLHSLARFRSLYRPAIILFNVSLSIVICAVPSCFVRDDLSDVLHTNSAYPVHELTFTELLDRISLLKILYDNRLVFRVKLAVAQLIAV